MQLAARFDRPVISFVDTPGAACNPDAEEHGISEAIAKNQLIMSQLPVPIVVIITGEGCSGGAIAMALGNRVLMLEHSYYSVIAPEACASILHRDPAKAPESAAELKITAADAFRMSVIDEVLPEPLGGAHRNLGKMCMVLSEAIDRHLIELSDLSSDELIEQRYARFRRLGDVGDTDLEVHAGSNGAPADNRVDEVSPANTSASTDGDKAVSNGVAAHVAG
jgi:acetyl-CoA carboxylase carboxyl transferase subunit alpha